jgi:hypothetical protein
MLFMEKEVLFPIAGKGLFVRGSSFYVDKKPFPPDGTVFRRDHRILAWKGAHILNRGSVKRTGPSREVCKDTPPYFPAMRVNPRCRNRLEPWGHSGGIVR